MATDAEGSQNSPEQTESVCEGIFDFKGGETEINNLARFAVSEYNNNQNAVLELKKVVIVKQQVAADGKIGMHYYITLEASDGKVYEAKVWVRPWLNSKEVTEFKLIGDAPSHPSA